MSSYIAYAFLLLIVAAFCIDTRYLKFIKHNSMDIKYYRLCPEENGAMIIKNPDYIICRMRSFLETSDKCMVDVDMRHTDPISLYSAIRAIEGSGINVKRTSAPGLFRVRYSLQSQI